MRNLPGMTRQIVMILLSLALIQFSHILDFVIMMPLGPRLMRVFAINPSQFGLAVSAYTISAGVSGLIAALFADRFDRKKVLLSMFFGFSLSTFLCGLAPSFPYLLLARVAAGFFGGVANAAVLAIIGDVIPISLRGTAMGVVMSSFSVASVVGVPLGLVAANHWGWHAPFLILGVICFGVQALAWTFIPPVTAHIQKASKHSPLQELAYIFTHRNHLWAFALTIFIMAGFGVFPFLSPYLVSNVKFPEVSLPLTYFVGGLFTFISTPLAGRLADRYGKHLVLKWAYGLSLLPLFLMTHLGPCSETMALAVSTLFMVGMSARMTPAFALITSSALPEYRGGFMSLNSSIQQFAAGFFSLTAGLMISKKDGLMTGFGHVGILAMVCTVIAILIADRIKVES